MSGTPLAADHKYNQHEAFSWDELKEFDPRLVYFCKVEALENFEKQAKEQEHGATRGLKSKGPSD